MVSRNCTFFLRLPYAKFNLDASRVDFRDPANFFHDVNSVAGLLKQFFRDLPDPLLTSEHYAGFIESASTYSRSVFA